MTRQEKSNVKAARYLARIIKITGALGGCWNGVVRYDTAEYEFWIYPFSVQRVNKRTRKSQSTCLRSGRVRMPDAEKIASILLLLHDNPKLFEAWRREAGYVNALAD